MKKRLTSLLLVFSMLLSLLPVSVFATEEASEMTVETSAQAPSVKQENLFADVKESDWFYDAVQYAQANGFFSGTSATTFAPGMTMTRGMFVTVLAKMAGVDGTAYAGKSEFTDVPKDAYYEPYVAWASQFGVTSGIGGGKFAPDVLINREQMATFFIGYFEKFDVEYETGANITTTPQDIDSVSSWAKDSVLKLWKQGLLVGDGKSFNPSGNASRAEAAAVCMSADKAVETWYSEPGVESQRVSVDPKAEQPEQPKPELPVPQLPIGGGSGSSGGSGSIGGSTTTHYKVTMHYGSETSEKLYPEGTLLNNVALPVLDNDKVFLGWFRDSALTKMVGTDEVLSGDIDLYAKVGAVAAMAESGKPSFIARLDIEESESSPVTIRVKWADGSSGSITPGVLKDGAVYPANADVLFRNITKPELTDGYYDADVDHAPDEFITITNGVIRGGALFTPGSTYQIELLNENLIFDEEMDNGDPADEYVRYFNFSIKKAEVLNLDLNPGMFYIPAGDLNAQDRANVMEYVGLYKVTIDAETGETSYTPNSGNGSFTYSGEFKDTIQVGNTVAVYKGNVRPDLRGVDDTGEVVYLNITKISGSTYYYEAAQHDDVLFTPDILPVDLDEGDGMISNESNVLVIKSGKLDFSEGYSDLGLDAATTVDVGDFMFFYTGDFGAGEAKGYGLITAVTIGAENASISYEIVTEEVMLKAMEMFVEEEPSDEQIEAAVDEQAIRESITAQIMESGFVVETGAYLAEMALMTDEVQSVLGEGLNLEDVTIALHDGTTVSGDELELMDGNLLHKGENVKLDIALTTRLSHFEKAKGLRVEVSVSYEFDIQKKGSDKKINVSLTAFFEQEVKLGFSVSGEAIWKKAWIIPYIADYQLSANADIGSYTGVGITAVAKTDADKSDSGMPWPKTAAEKEGTKKVFELTNSIKKKMEETKGLMKEGENTANGDLAEKYSNMVEEADDSWIDLFVVNIYEEYQSVAPAYILAYGIKIDFVVSANLYVALGVTFQYEASRRLSIVIRLNAESASSDTVDTGSNGFRFDAYVMGTMGIRAGIRIKVLAGLFTCKLDGIGIQAEVGAYLQMWGYFYFSISNYKDWENDYPNGERPWVKNKEFSGALLIEIGAYLNINFVAEVLDGKYAWTPSLYSNQWPFLQIGERENVNDFAYKENDERLNVTVLESTSVVLPTSLFEMKYMELTSGDVYGEKNDNGEWKTDKKGNELAAKNFDSDKGGSDADDEERFYITMGNERFRYDPKNNTVTINTAGTVQETCEMTITWAGNPLAFTNNVPSRTVTINWSNPEGVRYIQFNSNGGSSVRTASGPERGNITWPADPAKTGYTFAGWYYDAACTQAYSGSTTQLPADFGTNPDGSIIKGITLYAKWTPAPNRITVEHYQMGLSGRYELFETEIVEKIGGAAIMTDDAVSTTGLNKNYAGFTYNSRKVVKSHETVQPDGSTVIQFYYTRNKYTFTFNVNYPADAGTGINVVKEIACGGDVAAAKALCPGYIFDGWYTAANGGSEYTFTTMPASNVTVYAHWVPAEDTAYTVTHYKQAASGGWILADTEQMTGTTGAQTAAAAKTYEGFTAGAIEQQTIKANGSTSVVIRYNRESYTLTWKYADGATADKTEKVMFEASINAAEPVWAGHTFTGWKYEDGTLYKEGDTMPGKNVTLVACWDVKEFILSYDLTGGKLDGASELEDTQVVFSSQVTVPGAAEKTGYTFNGWADQISESESIVYQAGEAFGMPARNVTLTAQWTPNTYTVVYNANGGEGDMADSSFTYDLESKLTANTFTREGYSFVGWAAEENGEAVYGDGAAVQNLTAEADGTVTLYAVWSIGQYSISFKTDHGTAPAAISADYAESITLPTVSCPGWIFKGWMLDGEDYTTTTMPAENLELVAKWEALDGIEYTVEVYRQDLNGEYSDNAEIHVYANAMDTVVYAASGDFLEEGFAYDRDNSDNVESGKVSVDVDGNGDLVLKLYYTRNKPTITFQPNGGFENFEVEGYFGTKITLSNEFSRPGYTFVWKVGNETYEAGSSYTIPAEDVTLNGVWSAIGGIEYTVESYYQDVDGNYALGNTETGYGVMDETVDALNEGFQTNTPGFAYDEESSEASGKITVDGSGNGTLVLKLYYTRNQYTITFDSDGGTEVDDIKQYYGSTVNAPPEPTKEGYTFAGWYSDEELETEYEFTTMPLGGLELTAQWAANKYTITFDSNGGSEVNAITEKYGADITEPDEPTKTGHTFAGWYIDEELETEYEFTTMPLGGLTLYAKWDINQYTITLENIAPNYFEPITQDYGTPVDIPAELDFSPEGYEFDGWDTELPTTMPAKDMTITAKWKLIPYSISYVLNGGEIVGGENPTEYTVETPTFTLLNPVKEGYTFLGWYCKETGRTDVEMVTEKGESGPRTFEAKWELAEATITFVTNGGSEVDPITQAYGSTVNAPDDPTRNGYTFVGWYIDEELETECKFPVTMPLDGLTLYAKWEVINYTVTYWFSGKAISGGENPTTYNVEQKISLKPVEIEGYEFRYWLLTSNRSEVTELPVEGRYGDITLEPKVTAITYTIEYELDGGTLSSPKTSYDITTATFTLKTPYKVGYTFAGWKGTGVDVPSVTVQIANGSTGDRKYTAVWEPINYQITYKHYCGGVEIDIGSGVQNLLNSFNMDMENAVLNGNSKPNMPLPVPEHADYTFQSYSYTGSQSTAEIKNDGYTFMLNDTTVKGPFEVRVNWTAK